MKNFFIHADLDAFFASVEILDHPEWKNLPVIVGGKPEDRRSVVSTASYEARKYGVHSAMPTATAARLCPNGIFVRPRMERYLELSEKVMEIFSRYSPDIQQISIDEAFIDLTGTEKLFGPANKTALKIKQTVFKETGLTVSLGLAPTKYLAKLASEMNKPDGFFEIKEGEEEQFMLSLPLKKIWGLGEKGLALLKTQGINTTKDLHSKPLNLLTALFGQAAGSFLYGAVRGEEKETFTREPKSHSISTENTYSFDLTSKEAIETALLELSYTLIWRMRKENLRSFAIGLKIRYENFTTVTVHQTLSREIGSIDDLFFQAKKLFEKKADPGKGIRLLGLSLLNTESADSPRQRELFDFGEEKKRRVEEAVLKTQNNIPGIKITKARLLNGDFLKSILLPLFFTAVMLFSGEKIHSASETAGSTERNADGAGSIVFNSTRLPPQNEGQSGLFSDDSEKKSLFKSTVLDRDAEFFAEGYWKSVLTGNFSSTFSSLSAPVFSPGAPVLSSEVNLSLFFLLDRKWFFEADFADHFEKNTVAAGYYGEGILKNLRIANRGIIFPSGYSIDDFNRGIGGGTNLAPGISARFETQSVTADAVLKYDSLEAKTKTWYGKNLASTSFFELSDYVTGFQYVLPSKDAVSAVKSVFVEDSEGKYRDEKGRKFKKLNPSQYLLSAANCSIFFSKEAKTALWAGVLPAVAVEYDTSYSASRAAAELGSYGLSESPGEGFLGETQKFFSRNLNEYSLPLTGRINGSEIFYIQYPRKFSPYAACNKYDASTISAVPESAAVSTENTSVQNTNFSVLLGESEFSDVLTDFLGTTRIFAEVFRESDSIPISALYRFPFCTTDEGCYLGLKPATDLKVSLRSFTPVSRFEIGTNASGGTVLVFINGIQDGAAVYDKDSGCITLSLPVSASDKITAQWYEDTSNSGAGSLAASLGIKKQFNRNFSGDVSMAVRWTLPGEKSYSDFYTPAPGYAALAGGLDYSAENFRLKNTVAVSMEQPDTRGKYLISEMDEEKKQTIYLAKDAAVSLPDFLIPLLNPQPGSTDRNIELEGEKNGSVSAVKGRTDSEISGYAAIFDWDFSGMDGNCSEKFPYWAALSLKIPEGSGFLSSCSEFSIALKAAEEDSALIYGDFELFLQLGIEADEEVEFEDREFVPTWKIGASDGNTDTNVKLSFDPQKSGWQTVTVKIPEEQRQLLSENTGARLILTSKTKSSGRIYAGPCETAEAGFTVRSENGSDCRIISVREKSGSSNYITVFQFSNTEKDTFTLSRYFNETSLENYRLLKLNLKFAGSGLGQSDDSEYMTISFDRPQKDGTFKTALRFTLNARELSELSQKNNFYDIKINLSDKKTNLGTIEKLDTSVAASRFTVEFTGISPAELSLDSLYLEESQPYFTVQDVAKAFWKKDGEVLKIKDRVLLKDVNIQADAQTSARLKNSSNLENSGSDSSQNLISASARAGFVLSGIEFSAAAGKTELSHTIKNESPLFGILTAEDSCYFDSSGKTLKKSNSIKADFSPLKMPVSFSIQADAGSDLWALTQDVKASLNLNTTPLSVRFNSGVNQKILPSTSSGIQTYETKNYFSSWHKITSLEFDAGKKEAASRTVFAKASLKLSLLPSVFEPEYDFSAEEKYKNSSYTTYSDTTAQTLTLPFSIKRQNFYLEWKKSSGGTEKTGLKERYAEDFQKMAEGMNGRSWYFKAIPFFDLADSSLKKEVLSDSKMNENSTENLFYSTCYSAGWKRNIFGNSRDFYLPQNLSVSVQRDIKTSSSATDVCQFKGTAGYSAFNVFGSKSALHITDIFEQDEYLTSFSFALKLPGRDFSSATTLISFYTQETFYIKKGESLKTGSEFCYEDKNNFTVKTTAIWKRPGKSSFIQKPVNSIFRRFDGILSRQTDRTESKNKLSRTDSINGAFSKSKLLSTASTPAYRQFFEYLHTLDFDLNNFASVTTSLGLSYSRYSKKETVLSAELQIGATVKF
ncbi:MAG: DNA polymerase IV [Spirochaetia bacterium]|nr:DNA polymerase IV [Spirochaetia bacterium]